jgi:hypothetical protein
MSAENVRQLGTEELCRFLQTYFDQDEWKDVDRVIREQKIKGNSFLDITKAEWLSVGLTLGVATSLIQISQALLQRSASVPVNIQVTFNNPVRKLCQGFGSIWEYQVFPGNRGSVKASSFVES